MNMKKYIAIILITYLTIGSFILGFLVFKNPSVKNNTQENWPTPCPHGDRIATSKWRTFTTSVYSIFSIDYPEVLTPYTQSRFVDVSFSAERNSTSSPRINIDVVVFAADTWKSKDRTSGIKIYQCVGGPMISAYVFSGAKVYAISAIGLSVADIEHMMRSLMPLN